MQLPGNVALVALPLNFYDDTAVDFLEEGPTYNLGRGTGPQLVLLSPVPGRALSFTLAWTSVDDRRFAYLTLLIMPRSRKISMALAFPWFLTKFA